MGSRPWYVELLLLLGDWFKKGTLVPVPIFMISGGVFVMFVLTFVSADELIESAGHLSEVVLALFGALALVGYVYQKTKDTTDAVMNLLEITRTQIIPLKGKIESEIDAVHNSNKRTFYNFRFIRLDTFDLDTFRDRHSDIAYDQTVIFYTKSGNYADDLNSFCNLIEEFALSALNQGAQDKKQMEAVIPIYVQIVEQYVMYFFLQGLIPGNGNYASVFELYEKWRDSPCINRNASSSYFDDVRQQILKRERAIPMVLPAKTG